MAVAAARSASWNATRCSGMIGEGSAAASGGGEAVPSPRGVRGASHRRGRRSHPGRSSGAARRPLWRSGSRVMSSPPCPTTRGFWRSRRRSDTCASDRREQAAETGDGRRGLGRGLGQAPATRGLLLGYDRQRCKCGALRQAAHACICHSNRSTLGVLRRRQRRHRMQAATIHIHRAWPARTP